jgi:hypothetical protein
MFVRLGARRIPLADAACFAANSPVQEITGASDALAL